MRKLVFTIAGVAALGLVGTAVFHGEANAAPSLEMTSPEFHLALKESAPKADAMLSASPENITLWFTQAPQMSGTSVRLVTGGEPLEVGDAKVKEGDDTVVILEVGETLAPGSYEVHWRAMAQDGHTIRGDFGFMVH